MGVSEATLWTTWMHCGTLRAVTECTYLALDSERFRRILSPFPSPHAQAYAWAFVSTLNGWSRPQMTDLRDGCELQGMAAAFPEEWSKRHDDEFDPTHSSSLG